MRFARLMRMLLLPRNYLSPPNPNLGQVREIQSEGYQKSAALELTFRGKPSKWFSGQAQYTFGKTLQQHQRDHLLSWK